MKLLDTNLIWNPQEELSGNKIKTKLKWIGKFFLPKRHPIMSWAFACTIT